MMLPAPDVGRPPEVLQDWRRGEPLKADRLNEAHHAINRLQEIQPGARAPRGTARDLPAHPCQLKLQEVFPDYLRCRFWNGESEGGTDVYVAKPWLLRQTPFDGETRNGITYTYSGSTGTSRQGDNGEVTEDQIVIERYIIDDLIYASPVIHGGTATLDDEDNPIRWLEINQGRAWAKETV